MTQSKPGMPPLAYNDIKPIWPSLVLVYGVVAMIVAVVAFYAL